MKRNERVSFLPGTPHTIQTLPAFGLWDVYCNKVFWCVVFLLKLEGNCPLHKDRGQSIYVC